VARILRRAGMFIGTRLNESDDAVDLGEYSDVWINAFLAVRGPGLPHSLAGVMRAQLEAVLRGHRREASPEQRWGWKEPRSILLLPFLHEILPSLKFLHVIRDGRDMMLSSNQNQLRKHGGAYLGRPVDLSSPLDSVELWARLNLEAARYGAEHLGDRYFRVRFEDICSNPALVAAEMFEFIGLEGDPEDAAAEVDPPESIGRWREQDPALLSRVEQVAGEALREFGYLAD
jgi:Sulfotransferase family